MLTGIHVKDLALIDEIEVDFSDHLNILTGETGAGKSILIGSVNAALGGKASKDMVRKGAQDALVELFFDVRDEEILQYLKEKGIPAEDGQVTISRRITKTRSTGRINGEMVSAQILKKVGEMLVDIHGQHDHQSLLHKQYHLEILDRFCGDLLKERKKKLALLYREYRALQKELAGAVTDEEKRRRDLSFLEFEIQEIENAHLKEGEEEELFALYKKMSNSRRILEGVGAAYQFTGYEEGAGAQIGRALKELMPVEEYDLKIEELNGQLQEIDELLNDFNRELADYQTEFTFDEEEFLETQKRLDLIDQLKAKYGNSIEEILDYQKKAQSKQEKLQNYDAYLHDLRQREKQAGEALKEISEEVSAIRKEQAKILAEKITKALQDLNFTQVRFDWQFDRLDEYTENGIDDVQFLISLNPGEDLKPLTEIASGGELSRIMLAIKSVLADADRIETLIFDEIDTGISGRTAQKVSEKLALIAGKHQVLCITHLPQIAAMADSHYLIEKTSKDSKTTTCVTKLDEESMIEEIARLLGGAQITEAVRANARELKQMANQIKQEERKS